MLIDVHIDNDLPCSKLRTLSLNVILHRNFEYFRESFHKFVVPSGISRNTFKLIPKILDFLFFFEFSRFFKISKNLRFMNGISCSKKQADHLRPTNQADHQALVGEGILQAYSTKLGRVKAFKELGRQIVFGRDLLEALNYGNPNLASTCSWSFSLPPRNSF